MIPFDQLRITQLISSYGPDASPSLPLDFGDYLSLVWRLDLAARRGVGVPYFRKCEQALGNALGISGHEFVKLVRKTAPGQIWETIPNLPYRVPDRLVDAADRRAAISQLLRLRADLMNIGSYEQEWQPSWPGSGIQDEELRDRMFSILFTALPSQFPPFSRLLFVIDIVLQELLIGTRKGDSILLHLLVKDHGYPDPMRSDTHAMYSYRE